MTQERLSELVEQQPVVADSAIFDGEVFPKVDYLNKDLVEAALGAYSLAVRYFDAAWNEVQRPTAPGRYGALVDIRFASGTTDTRRLTLFKTATRYNPVDDPYEFLVRYPSAFGLSKEAVNREQWNADQIVNRIMASEGRQGDLCAVLAATMHDLAADPARWHGFNYWHVQESWWTGLEKKLGVSKDYRCIVTSPKDHDKNPEDRWPLILFLHGTYECGNDLSKLNDQGPLGHINRGHSLPFIVVSPLCPKGNSWNPEKLMRLIDQVEASHRVDPKRIYVTGLSMGGFSTFDLAACYPEKFAAAAPLSAGENPDIAERLTTVPMWIFHGAEDRIVSPRSSIEIAERLGKMGAEVKLTIYPGVGHEGWEKTYADPALYEWFLGHSVRSC
jgi:pimeloyl-ACP methyl ester carboxylesterase